MHETLDRFGFRNGQAEADDAWHRILRFFGTHLSQAG